MPSYSPSILIVDDNLGARRSVEGLLATEGYKLTLAESGFEAVEILKDHQPDLILLDVMMPGMSGYEVAEWIRSNSRLTEIPIIMITALDDDESMLKGIDAGADDFLSKPINKLELRSRVRGITRLNRYRKLCGERQKFEWVVQNSSFGFITVDDDDRIVFSNPRARELLSLDDADGLFTPQIQSRFNTHPEDLSCIWSESNKDLNPLLFIKPQTESCPAQWVEATVLNLDQLDSRQRLVRLADVSGNLRSFQEKETFSRMISHKLLTPLNALKAAQQVLSSSDATFRDEYVEKASRLQASGLERLEYDIDSIIRFLDSNESGKGNSGLSLGRVSELLRQIGNERKVPFNLNEDLSNSSDSVIRMSAESLESCVREIIENACKYHPKSSPKLDWHIHVNDTEQSVTLRFENDGEPLGQDEIENAWKPYWQSDRFFTGELKGMGLGLSMIATYVWSAGGTCEIANRSEQSGASVTLKIPVHVA